MSRCVNHPGSTRPLSRPHKTPSPFIVVHMKPLRDTPSTEAISPNKQYTLPQANAILCSFSCLLHVPRVPVKTNKHIQPKLMKEAFQIAPTSENIKNIRGSNLCSQCFKVNEKLNENQLEVAPEIMETPAIPAGEMCSQ